ncbi:MAG: methyltransferase [Anaerolineae bacterium]|nr:methyltransferase [Anaerolineae bacterium]NUQ03676.1 methyltransferase [Anaerolineae bacterium]
MNSRERVLRALRFENPDRAPRHLWYLPGVSMFRADELNAVHEKYPDDVAYAPVRYGRAKRESGTPNEVGTYVDAWGCGWSVGEPGVIGEVKNPPLADWSALDTYAPPSELFDGVDLSAVDAFCAASDQFVLEFFGNPFERMQHLRGTEALFMDIAYGSEEVMRLRDLVHGHNLRHLELLCQTRLDGVSFMDDWGSQRNLLISPKRWRELFKPLYADYCRIAHAAGKYVFMHSDGNISAIYPDLIEIGVDALNSQLFCMDVEDLARRYQGQITFWGEIDRQHVLAFGTPQDVRDAVRRVRTALDDGRGGVFAQCEWGINVPRANIEAVFEAWLESGG